MQNIIVTVADGVPTPTPWQEALELLLDATTDTVELDLGDGIELGRSTTGWTIRWTGQKGTPPPVRLLDVRGQVAPRMRRHPELADGVLRALVRGPHRMGALLWGRTRRYGGIGLELVVVNGELYASISV
ncbi:TPA: hypothetical protein DEB00_02815 [Candidatus Uhrbacteria bacterium]|nr:hypothetical protein [Candidatus Uhrbacteria bacterium]